MYELIKQIEDEIISCVRCGVCRIHCPTFLVTNTESAVSRGKIYLVNAVNDGELELTDEFAKDLYRCVNCRTVSVNCPTGVQVHEIVQQARAQLVKSRGLSDLKEVIFGSENGSGKHLAFFQEEIIRNLPSDNQWYDLLPLTDKKENFSSFLSDLPDGKVSNPSMTVGLFVGSAVDILYPEIGKSIINVLKANNIEVVIPKDQKCSGYSFRVLGDIDTAKSIALANVKTFMEARVDAIVTADSSCALELKQDYPKLLRNNETVIQFVNKVYGISDFLSSKVGIDKSKLGQISKKITYHEACTLGKGLKSAKPSRELLKAIPGLDFVEMKGAELCCGAGCNVFAMGRYNDLSMKIAETKFANIQATGADTIVTDCSYCQWQLGDMLASKGSKKEFLHPVQVLEMSLM